MKDFIKNFKKFLVENNLMDYNDEGMMDLYHYAKSTDEALILDPEYFVSSTSHYSRKEKEVANTPRVFFYADPNKTEMLIARDPYRNLFTTKVPFSEVYDLKKDPDDLIAQIREERLEREGLPREMNLRKGVDSENLFDKMKESYTGVFYSISEAIDIVAWFNPIEVYKIEQEEEK